MMQGFDRLDPRTLAALWELASGGDLAAGTSRAGQATKKRLARRGLAVFDRDKDLPGPMRITQKGMEFIQRKGVPSREDLVRVVKASEAGLVDWLRAIIAAFPTDALIRELRRISPKESDAGLVENQEAGSKTEVRK